MTQRRGNSSGRTGGFALLIVLWTLVLLALLGTWVTMTGRGEAQLAANIRTNAALEAQADGAINAAIFALLRRTDRLFAADDIPRTLRLQGSVAEVRIENLGGRIGLNVASVPLLQALLRHSGVDPSGAASLAAAIADWRSNNRQRLPLGAKAAEYRAAGQVYGPPNAPFHSLSELRLVLGMTPDLYARLAPYLSEFQTDDPDPAVSAPVVRQAIADVEGPQRVAAAALDMTRPLLAAITVQVSDASGARFGRRAVVRFSTFALGTDAQAFEILRWDAVSG